MLVEAAIITCPGNFCNAFWSFVYLMTISEQSIVENITKDDEKESHIKMSFKIQTTNHNLFPFRKGKVAGKYKTVQIEASISTSSLELLELLLLDSNQYSDNQQFQSYL